MTSSTKHTRKPKNASIQAQKAWLSMPTELKKELRKQLKDSDKDGAPDGFDCRPKNRRKQESFLPADAHIVSKLNHVTGTKTVGTGDNGKVQKITANKNLVVKTGYDGYSLQDEQKFFTKHKLLKEPLFSPSKAVTVGKTNTYGLLRPIVTPILDSNDKQKVKLTKTELLQLRTKIIKLSMKGYVFEDGLQLGRDRAGRILQFDYGLMYHTKNITDAFYYNNIAWSVFLENINMAGKIPKLTKPSRRKKK
jgi:hypothetical protein